MILEGDNIIKLKELADESVDIIFTSPPYAEQRNHTYGGVPADKYVDWFLPRAYEMKRVLKPTGSFFLNIKSHVEQGERNLYVMELVIAMKRALGFHYVDELVWKKIGFPGELKGRFKNAWEPIHHFTKQNPSKIKFNPIACGTPIKPESVARARRHASPTPVNGSGMTGNNTNFAHIELCRPDNVIEVNNTSNQWMTKKLHSATFPVGLCDFFIKSFSDKGDTVLDPFGGSGTTAVSAIELGREWILIEKDPKNIPLIKQRISNAQSPIL